MQPRPNPVRRLVLAHLEYAPGRLDLGPGTPSGDERAGEGGIREIDLDRVVQNPARARGPHSPTLGAAIFGKPSRHLTVSLAETAGRNARAPADTGWQL